MFCISLSFLQYLFVRVRNEIILVDVERKTSETLF